MIDPVEDESEERHVTREVDGVIDLVEDESKERRSGTDNFRVARRQHTESFAKALLFE